MEKYEPAMLDLHGAEWTSSQDYAMYPGAVRYEQYEKSFAAQVKMMSILCETFPPAYISPTCWH